MDKIDFAEEARKLRIPVFEVVQFIAYSESVAQRVEEQTIKRCQFAYFSRYGEFLGEGKFPRLYANSNEATKP